MNKAPPSAEYSTSDIYFSAFLCSKGYELKAFDKETDRSKPKVKFVFTIGNYELEDAKNAFFSGKGTVKAKDFVGHIRSLKSMCGV
jgi:hypothetical protein